MKTHVCFQLMSGTGPDPASTNKSNIIFRRMNT
jgi:hypothetical protein